MWTLIYLRIIRTSLALICKLQSIHFAMPDSRHWTRSVPHQADELPPCEGPKLRAFNSGQTPISWHERLDIDPVGSQGYA